MQARVQSQRVDNRLLLLGHRGSRTRGCRENTIAAFDTALRHGCDGLEFDVRATRDGRAVVCHNASSRGRSLARTNAARLSHLPLLDDVTGSEPGLEERFLAYERAAELHVLIGLLAPEQQHLLALRYGAGLAFDEIGAIVGAEAGTVRVRMHRILEELRRRYSHDD